MSHSERILFGFFVVLLIASIAACGGGGATGGGDGGTGGGGGGGGGGSPPPEVTFAFSLSEIPAGNGALGSIFSYTSMDGEVSCGAGFISSVSTRIFSNQNSVEFWCRQGSDAPLLAWTPISRPIVGYPTTLLGNVGGIFFDFIANSWYSHAGVLWDSSQAPGQFAARGDVITIRDDSSGRWQLTVSVPECEGLSVFGGDGYYGTLATGPAIGAAIVWRRALYVNDTGVLVRADIPAEPTDEACRRIPFTLLSDEPMFVYAMMPVGDTLWIGGGGSPFLDDQRHACAPLYATDGVDVEIVELEDCVAPQVTEIYSFLLLEDALYAGVYPDGYLFRIDIDARRAQRSDRLVLLPDTWTGAGRRYLESQSLTIAAGVPMVGMFPWGEIYQLGEPARVTRLFSGPVKTVEAVRPFETDDNNDWSQRITSLVTLNGEVCAGTGNTFSSVYDPNLHPFLDAALADEYGRVHCAPLPNQTLGEYIPVGSSEISFVVGADEISVIADGVVLASRPHSLSQAARVALAAQDGVLTVGDGVYGPIQATIVPTP